MVIHLTFQCPFEQLYIFICIDGVSILNNKVITSIWIDCLVFDEHLLTLLTIILFPYFWLYVILEYLIMIINIPNCLFIYLCFIRWSMVAIYFYSPYPFVFTFCFYLHSVLFHHILFLQLINHPIIHCCLYTINIWLFILSVQFFIPLQIHPYVE